MDDFLAAFGLAIVLEGVLYAAFPGPMRRAVAALLEAPDTVLRTGGVLVAVIGLVMVWMVRG